MVVTTMACGTVLQFYVSYPEEGQTCRFALSEKNKKKHGDAKGDPLTHGQGVAS